MIGYNTRLWFGKHQGRLVKNIIKDDPGYLFWLHYESDHVVSTKVLNYAKAALDAVKAHKMKSKKRGGKTTSSYGGSSIGSRRSPFREPSRFQSFSKPISSGVNVDNGGAGTPSAKPRSCACGQNLFGIGIDYCKACGHCAS